MRGVASLGRFARELKRRKVWHVAVTYVLVGAGVIGTGEAAIPEAVWNAIQLPAVALVLLGFPVALALAWAYEVRPEEEALGASCTPAAALLDARPGIVVLPFDNLSPDPSDAYFSDGLTEEIITALSYLRGLRVISRNSAMALKGTGKDTRAIGRELGVRYVLEGSVRKAGDALRITAQLIDARTDAHLWAERHNGFLADVFGVQERIATAIADAMEVELSPHERRRIVQHPLTHPKAYDTWVRAMHESRSWTEAGVRRALQLVDQAVGTVGENALLYASLAHLHWLLFDMGIRHEDEVLRQGEEYASRALKLDATLPQAWYARGLTSYKRGDMKSALRDWRRAVDLGGSAEVFSFLAFTLGEAGHVDQARDYAEEAIRLDPLMFLPWFVRATVHLHGGDLLESLNGIRDARARFAEGEPFAGWWYAKIAAYAGEEGEAADVANEVAQLPDGLFPRWCRLFLRSLERDRDGALDLLEEYDLRAMARTDETYPIFLANNLSLVGERDEALDWIERAIGWGFTNHVFLSRHNRFLEPLRDHPRFLALMERARGKQEELAS